MIILSCCSQEVPEDIYSEYGEFYFTMECLWHGEDETLWWCTGDPETELLNGHIQLALLKDDRLAFCGEDLILNSGLPLHDTMVHALTEDKFHCIVSEENNLGNEFDWIWERSKETLTMIWRPGRMPSKKLTLVIDPGRPGMLVEGRVYYKEL